MKKSDFYFDLPEELIAQTPAKPRDFCRLMCLDRKSDEIGHNMFKNLANMLKKGDVLVVNNSKVLPARLIGQRQGGSLCQLLLLRQINGDDWECLAKPGRRIKKDAQLFFGDGSLQGKVMDTLPSGSKIVRFFYDTKTLYEKLDIFGQMPLPHYIKSQIEENQDYQTVYAKTLGSAAAPTAGLHFTPQLIDGLKEMGITFAELTLHVGLGTFRPVQTDEIEQHTMHKEWYCVDEEAANTINSAKKAGGKIIAVGTTSCRTLESVFSKHGAIKPASGFTNIFLYPGAVFKAIDGLVTNFHLPESTLIMLVSAFYGKEKTMSAYKQAIKHGYKFYSFGDAMIIL